VAGWGGSLAVASAALVGWAVAARGQDKPEAPQAKPEPAQGQPAVDLSTRLRFVERYAPPGEKADSEAIGQYKVAIREAIKQTREKPQGAPDRTEEVYQTIYTERAARVAGSAEVTDTVRRYEAFRKTPDASKPTDPRPLEGLTLWYHSGAGSEPQILSLSDGRELHEMEYLIVARQVFVPDLRGLLPALPSRIGDSWRVSKAAARALLGERMEGGQGLTGKLQSVRKTSDGSQYEAVITIAGQFFLPTRGQSAASAEVLFTFTPRAAEAVEGRPAGAEGVVDARGAITEVRMALKSVFPLTPDRDERLRGVVTREVVLERRLGDGGAALAVPDSPPTPTEANSWVTYEDPLGRFHFRHPQIFHVQPPVGRLAETVELKQERSGIPDVVSVTLQPRTGQPGVDRERRDPEYHRRRLMKDWDDDGYQVIPGESGWLPEADWADSKMKVFRLEAALKPSGPEAKKAERVFYEFYLALFGRDESLGLAAFTAQDPPTTFRRQAREILKTFRAGRPNAPKPAAPPANPPG
jgi:hypothetical protein